MIIVNYKNTFVKTISSVCLLLLTLNNALAELSISALVNPKYNAYSSDTLFNVPVEYIGRPEVSSEQTIELTGNSVYSKTSLSYLLSVNNIIQENDIDQTNYRTNELYLTYGLNHWEMIAGRRINSSGFGYGFRPLDVIQQYDQQSTSLQSLIGKNMVGIEYYAEMSSWSFMWVNPQNNEYIKNNKNVENNELKSFVGKYSMSGDHADIQTVVRYNEINKVQAGFGGIFILSDVLSVHSSFLLSQQYEKQIHSLAGQSLQLLAAEYPYRNIRQKGAVQALFGLSWASVSKHSLVAEYWYNELAYSEQEWNELFQLAERQQGLLDPSGLSAEKIYGNIAWSALATQSQMLSMHNLMLQWNYDADHWKPRINFIMSPADMSSMTTLSILRAYNMFKLETGVRTFNGSKNSIYGGLILDQILYMSLSGEY